MIKLTKILALVSFVGLAFSAHAAVVPEYAANTYQNHELTRAEQKCLDEGYKITYANCSNQTAPTDKCPHHDSYYKSCSQEQWCRNNNYTFAETDCKAPFYPFKMCANRFPLYRICQENIEKACTEAGFTHKTKCQLTDKKCPFSPDYGICCDSCPDYAYALDAIPAGYVAHGTTCTTCEGVVKTNVVPASCDGFLQCEFGPMSPQTPSCLQGENMLYSACKTSGMVCQEKGFTETSCPATYDSSLCPENENFRSCTINCYKQALADNPQADIVMKDAVDPVFDLTKTELKSLVGMQEPSCQQQTRPTITLHINEKSMAAYAHLFDKAIENVNFNLIFEEPLSLYANGKLKDVRITASGTLPDCPLIANNVEVSGIVSFNDIPTLCSNFHINQGAKMLSSGNVKGNILMENDTALGLKGDLKGALRAKSYSEIFIKGILEFKDELNNEQNSESIALGCNTKAKIEKGILADTSSIYLKQWASLDTPSIKLISTSDNKTLPNTLSSIHMFKYAKIFNSYGETIYPIAENNGTECDDKYYIHLGSSSDMAKQSLTIEPANRIEDKWQCQSLDYKQEQCD